MMAGIEWSGIDELQNRLFMAHLNAMQAMGGAIYLEGQTIMTNSKQGRVPVAPDGGTLRNTGHVEQPEYSGHEVTVTLGYGGPAVPYALAVHEHPSEQHSPPSWRGKTAEQIHWNVPGSGPKFLEGPVNEANIGLGQRLARRIKRRIL